MDDCAGSECMLDAGHEYDNLLKERLVVEHAGKSITLLGAQSMALLKLVMLTGRASETSQSAGPADAHDAWGWPG